MIQRLKEKSPDQGHTDSGITDRHNRSPAPDHAALTYYQVSGQPCHTTRHHGEEERTHITSLAPLVALGPFVPTELEDQGLKSL